MALRIRRSITIGAGVGNGGGAAGAVYSVTTSGRRRRTADEAAPERPAKASAHPPPYWTIPAKPGPLALTRERAFFMGLEELKRGQPELALARFERAAERDTRDRALSDDLLAGLTAVHVGDATKAIPHLEKVVMSDVTLPDGLLRKYAPELAFDLSITPEVGALVTAGSVAAAFALVECYQEVGRLEEAVGLLQRLIGVEDHAALKVSLCELYADAGDWDEIVALGTGVPNADDLTLQILLYRALAHAELDQDAAARDVYDEALGEPRRSRELLKEALYERGRTHLRLQSWAPARRDLEEVYAEDPEYRDAAAILEHYGWRPPAGSA